MKNIMNQFWLLICIVILTGCAKQEVSLGLLDVSGRFNGVLELSFMGNPIYVSPNDEKSMCQTIKFGEAFVVRNGSVYIRGNSKASVGTISAKGDIIIYHAYGKFDPSASHVKKAYRLIEGHIGDRFLVKGHSSISYGTFEEGCRYEIEGYLLTKHRNHIGDEKDYQKVKLLWGSQYTNAAIAIYSDLRPYTPLPISMYLYDYFTYCKGIIGVRNNGTGNWSIECDDGVTATGIYVNDGDVWRIEGIDSNRNKIYTFKNI